MTLTAEQKAIVASWVTAGDNLSVIQKKLSSEFNLALTYMDVRFLVDDLDLILKDPAPKPSAQSDLSRGPETPSAASHPRAAGPDSALGDQAPSAAAEGGQPYSDEGEDIPDDAVPPQPDLSGTNVRVELDKITVHPSALASGSVTFTDGVTGKWIVDNQGRPGFTEISQPGYRPTPQDAQAFMQSLGAALQQRGF